MKKTKKILLIISLVIFIISTAQLKSLAANEFGISLETNSQTIQDGQEEVKFYIVLTNYNPTDKNETDFVPTLGYEAMLEYNKNIFENVTITSLNNWSDAEYYENTGKILATTRKAAGDTRIAEITLKLKKNVSAESAEVNLKNMILSDGKSTVTLNPSIEYTFAKNTQNGENGSGQPTTPTDENNGSGSGNKEPSTPSQEEQSGSKKPPVQIGEEEKIKVDVAKDKTTSNSEIPQTGEGTVIAAIIGTIIIATIFFIRYKFITRKIRGL